MGLTLLLLLYHYYHHYYYDIDNPDLFGARFAAGWVGIGESNLYLPPHSYYCYCYCMRRLRAGSLSLEAVCRSPSIHNPTISTLYYHHLLSSITYHYLLLLFTTHTHTNDETIRANETERVKRTRQINKKHHHAHATELRRRRRSGGQGKGWWESLVEVTEKKREKRKHMSMMRKTPILLLSPIINHQSLFPLVYSISLSPFVSFFLSFVFSYSLFLGVHS